MARSLSFFDNLEHKNGPRYLIACLPYFTVLNLGIKKSEFRRVNWLASVCMVPSVAKIILHEVVGYFHGHVRAKIVVSYVIAECHV